MPVFNYAYDPSVDNADIADTTELAKELVNARDPEARQTMERQLGWLEVLMQGGLDGQGEVTEEMRREYIRLQTVLSKPPQEGPDIDTVVVDIERAFKMPGYNFTKTDRPSVEQAVRQFQTGTDEFQQALMAQSQGLLQPLGAIAGSGKLVRKCELLPYEPLPNGKMPMPTRDQVFVRKDPKDPKKLQYIFLDPNDPTKAKGLPLDIDPGPGKLTATKLKDLESRIVEQIKRQDQENTEAQRSTANVSPYSHHISVIGGELNYNSFSKQENGDVRLDGMTALYGYSDYNINTFFYKPVGQPMQELSVLENRELFMGIEAAVEKRKREVAESSQASNVERPLTVEYEKEGQLHKVEIEAVLVAKMAVDLKKGDPQPHCKMEITNRDEKCNILIGDAAVNQKAQEYFEKTSKEIKELETSLDKAEKLQKSVNTWTSRLGNWLGGIVGGRSQLNKTMDNMKEMITPERLANVGNMKTFDRISNLYQTEEALGKEQTQALLDAKDNLRHPPTYPPAGAAAPASVGAKAEVVQPQSAPAPEPSAENKSRRTPSV